MIDNYDIATAIDEIIDDTETSDQVFDILTSRYFDETAPDTNNPKDTLRVYSFVNSYNQIAALIRILEEKKYSSDKKAHRIK